MIIGDFQHLEGSITFGVYWPEKDKKALDKVMQYVII